MKETILDAIMQFFDNQQEGTALPSPVVKFLAKLKHLGLAAKENNEGQPADESLENTIVHYQAQSQQSSRIYTPEEQHKLGQDCQRLLHFLEINRIIDCFSKEKIIHAAMEQDCPILHLDEFKHIVLVVLGENEPSTLFMEWLSFLFFNDDARTWH